MIESNNLLKEKFSKLTTKELTGHKKRVYTVDWNCRGNKIASGSADSTIRVNLNKQ